MNKLDEKKNNNILEYLLLDSSRFDIPIISKEDTSPFSINFINQKDKAMMPIYLDDSLPESNNKQEDILNNNYRINQVYSDGNCFNNIWVAININNNYM